MRLLLNNLKSQRVISRVSCTRMLSSIGGGTAFQNPMHNRHETKPSLIHAFALDHRHSYPATRNLSTRGGASSTSLRAYPQYSVYGEEAVMTMKMITPQFRLIKNHVLSMDTSRKGRILLEFAPRGVDGKHVWADAIRFGLSAEEAGLLVNQLPHYKVEFSRVQTARGESDRTYGNPVSPDIPEKVLIVEPGKLASVNFIIDYVRDGVGGQAPGLGQDGKGGPLKVEVHAGEFEVITSIMRHSIPHLTGWSSQLDIAMQNQINDTLNNSSGGNNSGGGNPGGGGGGDVPF